jgi:hypothetical protein
MTDDLIARAEALLEYATKYGPASSELYALVPELLAEVKRLREETWAQGDLVALRDITIHVQKRQIADLEAAVQRVRELHTKVQFSVRDRVVRDECSECCVSYPCLTIRALDGEES